MTVAVAVGLTQFTGTATGTVTVSVTVFVLLFIVLSPKEMVTHSLTLRVRVCVTVDNCLK